MGMQLQSGSSAVFGTLEYSSAIIIAKYSGLEW